MITPSNTNTNFVLSSGFISGFFSPLAKIEKIEIQFDKNTPVFAQDETVSGQIVIQFSNSSQTFSHGGIEVQLRGFIRIFYVNTVYQFLYSNYIAKPLAKYNEPHIETLTTEKRSMQISFEFENSSKPFETYHSTMSDSLFCITYDINVCIYPPTGMNAKPIMHHQEFFVHSTASSIVSTPQLSPTSNEVSGGVRLLCAAQNILELEILFFKLVFCKKDVITGTLTLQSIHSNTEITHIELYIIRRETIHADHSLEQALSKRRSKSLTSNTPSRNTVPFAETTLQNSISSSTNLAKFEIVDGSLPLNVSIPFRFPLSSIKQLCSSMEFADKVSLKYYANILIETNTNKRLYKQQEIIIL